MMHRPQCKLPYESCFGHIISSRGTPMNTSSLTLTQILAVWGALLSTFLAGVKFWELWNNRLKVDSYATWTGSEEEGHTITIRNLSHFPIMLVGWELFYRQQKFLIPQDEIIERNDFDWSDNTINPVLTCPPKTSPFFKLVVEWTWEDGKWLRKHLPRNRLSLSFGK